MRWRCISSRMKRSMASVRCPTCANATEAQDASAAAASSTRILVMLSAATSLSWRSEGPVILSAAKNLLSEHVEIVRGDDLSLVARAQLLEHSRLGVGGSAEVHLVVDDQRLGLGLRRDVRQLLRARVKSADVIAPRFGTLLVAELRVDLVDQNVAAAAIVGDALARRRVSGDHDGSVGRLETVAVRVLPRAVLHREHLDRDIGILVHEARLDVVGIHIGARLGLMFQPL